MRSCDPFLYADAIEKIKREAKSPQGSPGHKKVLARLHSLKVGAFKPSQQASIHSEKSFLNSNTFFLNQTNFCIAMGSKKHFCVSNEFFV